MSNNKSEKKSRKQKRQERSQKEQMLFFFGIIVFVILISFKIWIKMTFELKMIGLLLLIAVSWTFKYLLFKHLKGKIKKEQAENAETEETEETIDEKDLPKI